MATKKKESAPEKELAEAEVSIKASEFNSDKYKALNDVSEEMRDKALKVLEDMGLLADTEESSFAAAAIAEQMKKSEIAAAEVQKKNDSLSPEEKESIEMKRKVQSFNFYDFYMKKMGKK